MLRKDLLAFESPLKIPLRLLTLFACCEIHHSLDMDSEKQFLL